MSVSRNLEAPLLWSAETREPKTYCNHCAYKATVGCMATFSKMSSLKGILKLAYDFRLL